MREAAVLSAAAAMDLAARVRALRAAGDPAAWDREAAGDDAVEALHRTAERISAFHMLGEVFEMMRGGGSSKITYEMKGKLNGSGFNSTHFRSHGEFDLPASWAS
jgi:hypothetical protein